MNCLCLQFILRWLYLFMLIKCFLLCCSGTYPEYLRCFSVRLLLHAPRGLMGNERECKFSSFSSVHVVVTRSMASGTTASIEGREGALIDRWMLSLTSLQCQRWRVWYRRSRRRDWRSWSLQRDEREKEEKRSQEGWLWVWDYTSSSHSHHLYPPCCRKSINNLIERWEWDVCWSPFCGIVFLQWGWHPEGVGGVVFRGSGGEGQGEHHQWNPPSLTTDSTKIKHVWKSCSVPSRKQIPQSTRRSLSLRNQRRRKPGRKRGVEPVLMMRRVRKDVPLRRGTDSRKLIRRWRSRKLSMLNWIFDLVIKVANV